VLFFGAKQDRCGRSVGNDQVDLRAHRMVRVHQMALTDVAQTGQLAGEQSLQTHLDLVAGCVDVSRFVNELGFGPCLKERVGVPFEDVQ
jgi:hypothetical protein